jgi:SpoVK/Ycf46/Vps4 family AAA+-type ATPase
MSILWSPPPGTGKTLTAALLGKRTGQDVYRIDLSMVVSKYVGETEKSLRRIFDLADRKPWILFFDEAEALFSKRTEVQDAHDRFANQVISYLLYRIEEHDGIVILATNKKSMLDDAFTRRFQCVVSFSLPSTKERLQIWQKGFSPHCCLEKAINLETIANQYELAGGSIMNIIRYASLMALKAGSNIIMLKDIIKGIQREYSKEGKSFASNLYSPLQNV